MMTCGPGNRMLSAVRMRTVRVRQPKRRASAAHTPAITRSCRGLLRFMDPACPARTPSGNRGNPPLTPASIPRFCGYKGLMPTRLLLLADTHLPTRAKELRPSVWRAVEGADVVIHAGQV
jgi:hypothetical protein